MRTPRTTRAARAAARTAATNPDPAQAVKAAQETLGRHVDRYRISVSRPGVAGRLARVTVTHARRPWIAATASRKVER